MSEIAHLKFNDLAPDIQVFGTNGTPVQLSSLWKRKVLVLAFTRHFGCPQCKEMVSQLLDVHDDMVEKGLRLAIVSHASPQSAKEFCKLRAPKATCLADPDRSAYHAYGLYQGTLWQTILSPRVWISNRRLAKQKGFNPELPPEGQDAAQMSGTFVIGTDGRIRLPYYYDDISDHPPADLILHGVLGVDWKKPYNSKPVI